MTEEGPLGILPLDQALAAARERSLDLVEIAPQADPPVAKIMDYGKFIFQEKKKAHESKKKQKSIQVKEVKFRPRIDDHDYDFKKKNIIKFLEHGDKVKATVQFRGREMSRQEFGRELIRRLLGELEGVAILESNPEMMGNRMHAILAPAKKAATAPKPAEPKPVEPKPAAPKAEARPVETKPEPKPEPKVEAPVEPKAEAAAEPAAIEPKAEAKAAPKVAKPKAPKAAKPAAPTAEPTPEGDGSGA